MNQDQRAEFEAWAKSKRAKKEGYDAFDIWQAALESQEVQALRDALKVANDALEEISNEMTVGDRWTNAGQSLLDALPVTRAALAQEQGEKHDNQS